jgi:hypothetical protein
VLEEHGYEFELIEQDQRDSYDFELPDFPSDDERYAVRAGSLVKLIFRYRDWVEEHEHTITCERMWVLMTGDDGRSLLGTINNAPRYTNILREDDVVRFHPKHIIQIWQS